MKNTIVYLIGYAGTGKYTIAREIAGLTGAVIVDNQLINNPVFSVVGMPSRMLCNVRTSQGGGCEAILQA
jgi:predicted kinase